MDEMRLAIVVSAVMLAVFIAGVIKSGVLIGFLAALGILVIFFFSFCCALAVIAGAFLATFTPDA